MNRKTLTEKVLKWFVGPGSRPVDKSELARQLKIPVEQKSELKTVLRELASAGKLEAARGGRYRLPPVAAPAGEGKTTPGPGPGRGAHTLAGKVLARSDGLFFIPDLSQPGTAQSCAALGITPETKLPLDTDKTATALPGDEVVVEIAAQLPKARGRRPSGDTRTPKRYSLRVARVTSRRHETMPGTLHMTGKHAWVAPDDPFLPAVAVPLQGKVDAGANDKVVVAVDDWTPRGKRLRGHLVERLGAAGDPGVDVLGIIATHRLSVAFPQEVLREAAAIPVEIPADEIARREDWRDRHVITIDPFDAKDFDDAICVTELPKGGWELAVHIADVSHYVRPGTALDREAQNRGNSTYLVDRVLPMLPERLSNGLCSLRPGEDKLTFVAVLTFDAKGRRTGQRFAPAVIRSKRRYTYEEAMACLSAPPECDPDAELLHRAWKLAFLLRTRRFANGSLDLQFTEVKVLLDSRGHPLRFVRLVYDESHQLIEEFMLAANEAVAETTLRSGRPGMYRIHEDPDPGKLEELREMLHASGVPCGDLAVKGEIQEVLRRIEGKPEEHVLKVALLKSFKRAVYSPDALGHYGLALRHYTHFTSPIRRYADLIVHRVLNNIQQPGGRRVVSTPDYAEMGEIAEHISATERTSAAAEMDSRRMKELEYFERLAGSREPEVFQAIVTRVLPIGLFVEVVDIQTRGIVRAGDPALRDYRFDSSRARLVSRTQTRDHLRPSDVINVVPVAIERERGTVVFRIAAEQGRKKPAKKKAAAVGRLRPRKPRD